MQFLDSANHYGELGEHRQQFAAFLTYAALGPTAGYEVEEFRCAFGALPQEGLEESAQSLYPALEGADDQREDYWKNRVQPFWQQIWPKSLDRATPRIAASLAQLAIAARREFPAALKTVSAWLKPIEHVDIVIQHLHDSDLCKEFPLEALSLLSSVIDNQPLALRELKECLKDIVQAAPQLEQDHSYRNLREYIKAHE